MKAGIGFERRETAGGAGARGGKERSTLRKRRAQKLYAPASVRLAGAYSFSEDPSIFTVSTSHPGGCENRLILGYQLATVLPLPVEI